jgi:shikimate kinase
MSSIDKNLVLIGMPGSGKSTIGIILAKKTSRDFVDTDVVIQNHEHRSLQDIVDKEGYMKLREIEEKWVMTLEAENSVIATGGSVVYSEASMKHLAEHGIIIFLDVHLDTLKKRITDYDQRGIARRPEQSFDDLFAERSALYNKYAHFTIESDTLGQETACQVIIDLLD